MKFTVDPKKTTVLMDLDGTLLPMDIRAFEKMYFEGLCHAMKDRIQAKDLIRSIWAGMNAMVHNDGTKTNEDVFVEAFCFVSHLDYEKVKPDFMDYYANSFEKCQKACQITSLSKKIVTLLQEKGYQVAIATNPIFPMVATYARLHWLGIDPKDMALVTTFENSHHAKPDPAYYEEVLRKLHAEASSCVMIGNDVKEDGIARKIGIEVKLISDHLLNEENLPTEGFELGSLKELYEWALSLPKVGAIE